MHRVTLYGLSRLYLGIYMHIYVHSITINKKEVMNFKESKEDYMGRSGERKRKGENVIII